MAYVKKYALVRVEKTCLNTECGIRIVKAINREEHNLYIDGVMTGLVTYRLIVLEKGYFEPPHTHLLNVLIIN